MRLIHVLVEGILLDTLILFPLLVLGGHLLARKKPLEAATSAGLVLVSWVGILTGLWVIGQALGGVDVLSAELFDKTARAPRAAMDTQLSLPGAYAHAIVLAALLAYAVNIVWARFSAARYLFLNPIHVVIGASVLLLLFFRARASVYVAVPVTGVVIGSGMAWLPWLSANPYRLTGKSSKFDLGSLHTTVIVGVAWLAQKLGGDGKRKSTKDGEGLLTAVITGGVFISVLSLLLAINAGAKPTDQAVQSLVVFQLVPSSGAAYYLVGALMLGFVFAAGLWILLFSASHVLTGIVECFQGWRKLLPKVTPALDGLFMLSESPRDAVIGFLLSLAGGMVGFYFFGWIGLTAAVPGTLVAATAGHFISGGVAGTIAARIGGNRALLILLPAHGLILSLVTAMALSGSRTVSAAAASPAGTELIDVSIVATLASWILRLFN